MPSASWVSDTRSAPTHLMVLTWTALATVVIASVFLAMPGTAGAQPVPSGVITLTSQSPWVQRSNVPIHLGLSVRSPLPNKDLLVDVALYTEPDQSALASRDEFDATLGGQLTGLNQLAYTTFSLDTIDKAHGSVDIYVSGSELPGQVPKRVPSDQVFQLPCPARYGGCGGVYPLEVTLNDVLTGQPVDSFTSYLIVAPPSVSDQEPLRFSFVVPVGASPALGTGGNPAVPPATLAEIYAVAGAEARWQKVPVTIDLFGQALLALARSPHHTKLVDTVSYGGLGGLVDGPFSAINPTQLVRSGLGADLARQIGRGDTVFDEVLRVTRTTKVYIATGPLGARGLAALSADGIKDVVIPEDNLQSVPSGQPSTVQWPYTLSAPFQIEGSGVEGLQADPGLAAHLVGPASQSLRAQQLLADLAEIYFDSPDFPLARGVAVVAPSAWTPQPQFLSALLKGLSSSPMVATVPISQLFATVQRGTCQVPPTVVTGCSAAIRALANPSLNGSDFVTASQVETARTQLRELSSVIPAGATLHNLDDSILLAETAGLSPQRRESYLSAPLATMARVGSQVGLPAGRVVTVTSASARFPIAITSTSRTPIHAVLAVSGPDLTSSTFLRVTLRRGTNSLIIRVHTRTSGDSSLQLQLLSPAGHVQLAHAELTIRSTAISEVAVALTIGAAAFLVVWWLRSAGRRRRRRAKHAAGQVQAPEAVQEPAT